MTSEYQRSAADMAALEAVAAQGTVVDVAVTYVSSLTRNSNPASFRQFFVDLNFTNPLDFLPKLQEALENGDHRNTLIAMLLPLGIGQISRRLETGETPYEFGLAFGLCGTELDLKRNSMKPFRTYPELNSQRLPDTGIIYQSSGDYQALVKKYNALKTKK